MLSFEEAQRLASRLRDELGRAIIGQEAVVQEILTVFVAGGHCLLRGVPGLAKTLLIKTLAQAVHLKFNRIQFTPDLMPSDIIGTEVIEEDRATGRRDIRFVPGPVYYKRLHGANLHLKRQSWSEHQKQLAWASLAAWMIEVVAPAGRDPEERRRLFDIVLARFLVPNDPWKWVRAPARRLASTSSRALGPLRVLLDRLKHSERILNTVAGRWMLYETSDPAQRAALLGLIFDRLKSGGRFDPSACLQSTWQALEKEANKRFIGRLNRGTKQAKEKP